MDCALTAAEIAAYTQRHLETFFPVARPIDAGGLRRSVDRALERVEQCFIPIRWPSYGGAGAARFDVLNSDQYCAYLYLLSNTVHRDGGDPAVATKLFYLNKALHSFNCMYDTELPEVFWIVHALGTVLGKAHYGEYFVVHQGCTVGALSGGYPVIGERVVLSAGVTVVGGRVGDNVTIAPGCTLVRRDIPANTLVTAAGEARPLTGRGASALFYLGDTGRRAEE